MVHQRRRVAHQDVVVVVVGVIGVCVEDILLVESGALGQTYKKPFSNLFLTFSTLLFEFAASDFESRPALDVAERDRPVAASVVVPRVLVRHDLNAVLRLAPVRLPRVKGVEAVGGLVELLARVRIDEPPLRELIRPSGKETNCGKRSSNQLPYRVSHLLVDLIYLS